MAEKLKKLFAYTNFEPVLAPSISLAPLALFGLIRLAPLALLLGLIRLAPFGRTMFL
jgi:hypothetical protein